MYKLYEHTFYLNTKHAIYINGKLGEPHSHTWEFTLTVRDFDEKVSQFSEINSWITPILAPYEKSFINDIAPFDKINPTLENVCKYFNEQFFTVMKENNMFLEKIRICESIKCSYIIINDAENYFADIDKQMGEEKRIAENNDALIQAIISRHS